MKAGLDRDVKLGVLERVPTNTPVTYCSRMVIATKSNGTPRRTVDLQALNRNSVRQTHHTRSPYHLVMDIPPRKKKTVFDAWNGFHSVPIHADDRHYTTFLTEWGRYRYKMTPQGHKASQDGYTHRFDNIVEDIKDKARCVDDTLLWDDTTEASFFRACEFLDRCGRNGIILNPEKFQFAEDTVEFVGFEVGLDGIKPAKKYYAAVNDFPRPVTLSDIRSFFGLVEQVAYTFYSSEVMAPFRELLKPGNAVKGKIHWDDNMEEMFKSAKVKIIEAMEEGVRMFDPRLPTAVGSDWSKTGIGHTLSQKHCTCPGRNPRCCPTGWKFAAFASRFTHPAEQNYSPVEGECLSAAVGLRKFKHFVLGCNDLILVVDHKPLVRLLGDRRLEDIDNVRLMKLKEKTLPFRFNVVHCPGKFHKSADAGSRYPCGQAELFLEDEILAELVETTEAEVYAEVVANLADVAHAVSWRMVREATNADPVMSRLRQEVEEGYLRDDDDTVRPIPAEIADYGRHMDNLSVQDDVILYNGRTVIPEKLRGRVLDTLHSAHQGSSQMRNRAETSVFWPGLHRDIENRRAKCPTCRIVAPSQANLPPYDPPVPEFPFQYVCSDFFQLKGSTYLVTVDRLTGWPDVRRMAGSLRGSKGLTSMLRDLFMTFGIPEELASDGGPEFTAAETKKFLDTYDVHHRRSSVGNPHANQRAEVGVKSMKRLLRDNTDVHGKLDNDRFTRAILQYRNTPEQSTGMSPAMELFGRQLRDFIPLTRANYKPSPQWLQRIAAREAKAAASRAKAAKKWQEHSRRLPDLRVGDYVSIQNMLGNHPLRWDRTGMVVEVRQHDQYTVRIDGTGHITLRNRKNLRRFGHRPKPAAHQEPLVRPPAAGPETPATPPAAPDNPPAVTPPAARPETTVTPPAAGPETPATPPAAGPQSPSPPPAAAGPPPAAASPPAAPATPRRQTERPRRGLNAAPEGGGAPAAPPHRMLSRLQSHNQPGRLEEPIGRRRREK